MNLFHLCLGLYRWKRGMRGNDVVQPKQNSQAAFRIRLNRSLSWPASYRGCFVRSTGFARCRAGWYHRRNLPAVLRWFSLRQRSRLRGSRCQRAERYPRRRGRRFLDPGDVCCIVLLAVAVPKVTAGEEAMEEVLQGTREKEAQFHTGD